MTNPEQRESEAFVLVPVEPTEAMVLAGERANWDDHNHMPAVAGISAAWSAMLAAAPSTHPPVQGEVAQRELIALLRREGRHSGVWFAEHLLTAADLLERNYLAALSQPTSAADEVERLKEAEVLFRLLIANDDECSLMDAIDNDGAAYQSAQMAGLMVHIRGWLPGSSVADCMAKYRAALTTVPDTKGEG